MAINGNVVITGKGSLLSKPILTPVLARARPVKDIREEGLSRKISRYTEDLGISVVFNFEDE